MSSVRKREWQSKGKRHTAFVVDYRDLDGKRRLQTFRTEREASAFKAAWDYAMCVEGIVTHFKQSAPSPVTTNSAEIVYGVEAIADALHEPNHRRVYYMLEQGQVPGSRKMGRIWALSIPVFRREMHGA